MNVSGDTTCVCGDVFDEHDADGECTVANCMCFYFEEDPGNDE